jgi:hypothetical protein
MKSNKNERDKGKSVFQDPKKGPHLGSLKNWRKQSDRKGARTDFAEQVAAPPRKVFHVWRKRHSGRRGSIAGVEAAGPIQSHRNSIQAPVCE